MGGFIRTEGKGLAVRGSRDELDRLKAAQVSNFEAQRREDIDYIEKTRMNNEMALQVEKMQRYELKKRQNLLVKDSLMEHQAISEMQRRRKEEEIMRFNEMQRAALAQEEQAKRMQQQIKQMQIAEIRGSYSQNQQMKAEMAKAATANDAYYMQKQLEEIDRQTQQRNALLTRIRGGFNQNHQVLDTYNKLYADMRVQNERLQEITVDKPAQERIRLEEERVRNEEAMRKAVMQQNRDEVRAQAEKAKREKEMQMRAQRDMENDLVMRSVKEPSIFSQ